jgi:hypothetical protein
MTRQNEDEKSLKMPISICFLSRFYSIFFISLIIILLIIFSPLQRNQKIENSDRTVALIDSHEIQLISTNLK